MFIILNAAIKIKCFSKFFYNFLKKLRAGAVYGIIDKVKKRARRLYYKGAPRRFAKKEICGAVK